MLTKVLIKNICWYFFFCKLIDIDYVIEDRVGKMCLKSNELSISMSRETCGMVINRAVKNIKVFL